MEKTNHFEDVTIQVITKIQYDILQILSDGDKSRHDICEVMGFETYTYNYTLPNEARTKAHMILHKKRTTVYDNLLKLLKMGIVEKYRMNKPVRGRPSEFWKLKYNLISKFLWF